MESIYLTIMPSFESIRKLFGFKESDNYDSAVIFKEQKSFAHSRLIEDREIFEIEEGCIGQVISESKLCLLHEDDIDKESAYDNILEGDLPQGKYQFWARNKSILILDTNFIAQDNYSDVIERVAYDEFENDVEDENIEKLFDLITNSAKNRFDYGSFSEDMNGFDSDYILFQIIASLACEEPVKLTIAKITNQFILSGAIPNEEYLKEFILQRRKDLGVEILAFNMANANLDNDADPLAVYYMVEDFLSKMN